MKKLVFSLLLIIGISNFVYSQEQKENQNQQIKISIGLQPLISYLNNHKNVQINEKVYITFIDGLTGQNVEYHYGSTIYLVQFDENGFYVVFDTIGVFKPYINGNQLHDSYDVVVNIENNTIENFKTN